MNTFPENSKYSFPEVEIKKKKTKTKKFRQCKDCPLQPSTTKTVSKVGMVATLGASAASGVLKFKAAKPLHIWASVAFLGFTALHWAVSARPARPAK
ncbi:hypothetical protein [Desulfovibrio sp. JC010]|uniref:hypothetical protein n=1 Tax=Desulfovibrio sp. JC010 TaxID=2593641 RepID=UPI0013D41041|nr:hypothetical protein [Desulfovibrio sp. JC010]NDV28535.1 hypothetical protein [Desulfovibrio sp. JC010]